MTKRKNPATVWVGTRAIDIIPFERFLSIDVVISCDYGSDVQALEHSKAVYSLERETNTKHPWNNFHLNYAFDSQAQDTVSRFATTTNRDVQFLCYSSSLLVEEVIDSQEVPATYLNLPSSKKELFDNKIVLQHWLARLSISRLPSTITVLGNVEYDEIRNKYGEPFVVKLPIGSAGGRVFLITQRDEFR